MVLAGFALAGLAPAFAQTEIIISAGPEEGIASIASADLGVAGDECGIDIDVVPSAGAMASLEVLLGDGGADAVVLQRDVLDYLQSYVGQDPRIAQAVGKLELAVPLFDQELHVLVAPGIEKVTDLNGKRVNMGPLTGGGFLTATIVLDLLSIQPSERLRLTDAEALEALKTGGLDAVMLVDAAPSRIVENAGLVSGSARLLDVQDPFLSEFYDEASIPAGTYFFDSEPRTSISVHTYLMVKPVPVGSPLCSAVADTVAMIVQRPDLLAAKGHTKWQSLDISRIPLAWPVSACAAAGLDLQRPLACK